MFKQTVRFNYTENVVPPRCRKARRVELQTTMQVSIREVTSDEAPVAIREYSSEFAGEHVGEAITEYRWYAGKLWILRQTQARSLGPWKTETVAEFRAVNSLGPSNWYASKAEVRKTILGYARDTLFIDGLRWEATGEPRYVVMTFGLGHNHGIGWGTSLSTDTWCNSNISGDRYVRCDDYQGAVALATRIAIARGDTKALPIEDQNPTRFEVLIPEAVRLKPSRKVNPGDSFLNAVENMIEGTKDTTSAAIGMFGVLAASMQ